MEYLEKFYTEASGLLLVAPPGWGKTYNLLKWVKESQYSFVYLSPLRALSEEVFIKTQKMMRGVYFVRTNRESKEFVQNKIDFKLLIVSFEVVSPTLFKRKNTIFVLDEFHLIYHWGDTFREVLSEVYMGLFSEGAKTLLLTATMSDFNTQRLREEIALNQSNFYFLNIGNHQLKNKPKHIFYYPRFFKNKLIKNLENELKGGSKNTIILFCEYRSEVLYYKKYFKDFIVLTARGGETQEFTRELNTLSSPPDLIIATTCISHGVNLPLISNIYFNYHVGDLDFYIQMVGRGGRKGESFDVHSLEEKPTILNFLALLKVSVILKLKALWREYIG